MKIIYRPFCKRCGGLLCQELGKVSEGYQFACLACDEDFCTFEVNFKEIKV